MSREELLQWMVEHFIALELEVRGACGDEDKIDDVLVNAEAELDAVVSAELATLREGRRDSA